MSDKIKFYDVNLDYIDFLKKFESKVPDIKYETREKFVSGVLFEINEMKYYAPVSSFKNKQKTNYVIKIGDYPVGSIRFSFMFPVPDSELKLKDFSTEKSDYRNLVNSELRFINKYRDAIRKKAFEVYNLTKNKKIDLYTRNCCDFELLETKCKEYIEIQNNALMDLTNEEIETAMELAYKQTEDNTNNISFEFEDYIVNNPFYNNETMEELSLEEAIEIYGKENVEHFIVSIIEEQSNKHGGRSL